MNCSDIIDRYLPGFDEVWDEVSGEDRWLDKEDAEYEWTCKQRGIDPCDELPANDDARAEAAKSTEDDARESYRKVKEFLTDAFSGKDSITLYRSMRVKDIDLFLERVPRLP